MARTLTTVFLSTLLYVLTLNLHAQEGNGVAPVSLNGAGAQVCVVSGRFASGDVVLPGVAVTLRTGESAPLVTSTSTDGRFELRVPSPASYTLTAELAGFTRLESVVDASASCPPALDLRLTVMPRAAAVPDANGRGRGARAAGPGRAGAGRGGFETLTVEPQATDATAAGATEIEANPLAQLALPPGFSTDGPTESVAVNGNQANVDRGQLGDRLDALARGEFGAPPVDIAAGFGPAPGGVPGGFAAGGGAFGGAPGQGQGGFGPGGRGGPGGAGGPGGPGGRGFLAGRGVQQRPYTFTSGYTFGGSALDSTPYQLRPGSAATNPDYTRQNADFSVGGPVKIPGIYDGTRKTNFTFNYTGNRGANLFDQYATVPSAAMRAGDFSSLTQPIINPATGLPFANNQVTGIDPRAQYLLSFLPLPNLDGTSRNYHSVTTTDSSANNINLRIVQNFTPNVAGRGGRGAGPRGGGAGGARGRGAQAGTSAVLNAQVQYRSGGNERNNVFQTLGGDSTNSSLTVPITLNVTRARMQHTFTTTFSRTRSTTTNQYAFVEDVAGRAGITGASPDAFDWGVPTLSFASLSSLNDLTPTRRSDSRVSVGYSWSKPIGRQTLRFGGDLRRDVSSSRTDSNARGSFVFTGLYSGSDFADFLLGRPQQASVNYGPGDVELHGRSMSLFAQDDWRRGAVTINAGLRYELLWPLVEGSGQLVNLDVAPDFSAAVPVTAGGTGPYAGSLPDGLIRTDYNNFAPRIGIAWRATTGTVVRGGYGVSFNNGSYSTLARQMAGQPPYAVTNTSIGSSDDPLDLASALAVSSLATTTNTFGVAPDYQLGRVQTMNVDLSRDLGRVWTTGAGYTYARGSSLDLVRAPNRGPTGLRIEGVQPFLWQTSEAESRLNSATFRLRRRPVRGVGGGVDYTLARSRDDAASTGGGSSVVAQDDQNLAGEWGLSTFDRRHQVSANANVELPFGENRRWLNNGGPWARLFEAWTASVTFTAQSGTPLTARVLSSSRDVARGTNGTLRADYNGDSVQLQSPTIDQYFNTSAFSLPAAGSFGSAGRNTIIGPGSKELNAQVSRDVRLGNNRSLSIQVRANNLLNLVNYAAIDTVVNSPSFGQVTSVRAMRSMQLVLRFRY
ncbi:MAG: TonB-dependent receptor [Vicinamibacterales bacterium]